MDWYCIYITIFMHLGEGEEIVKIYHHHPTPYIYRMLKIILATFPFLLILFVSQESFHTTSSYIIAHVVVLVFFSIVVLYVSLIYWLDKLVVTNQRVVYIDWQFLTIRKEVEALLEDIQDIATQENGFLAFFKVFDYGTIKVETASSHVTLQFNDAPDPEAIRKFIYHVRH